MVRVDHFRFLLLQEKCESATELFYFNGRSATSTRMK